MLRSTVQCNEEMLTQDLLLPLWLHKQLTNALMDHLPLLVPWVTQDGASQAERLFLTLDPLQRKVLPEPGFRCCCLTSFSQLLVRPPKDRIGMSPCRLLHTLRRFDVHVSESLGIHGADQLVHALERQALLRLDKRGDTVTHRSFSKQSRWSTRVVVLQDL